MKYSLLAFAISAACTSAHVYANTSEVIDSTSTEVITVIGSSLNDNTVKIERETVTATTNIDADFGDQLAQLPGVSVSRNGPVTGLIQYRGLFGDRVGVSIDGVDIAGAGPNSMDSPLSHVLPEPGLTATLYRGIVPVSAGVQTLGGKLRINADAASLFALESGIAGSVNASLIGPGSGQQYQGNVLYKTGQAFISGAFMHQQRDERESGDNAVIPKSHYQRNGGKFRFGYEWGKHQFDASYQQLNTNESGTPALAMDIGFIDAAWYRLGYRYNAGEAEYLAINWFGNSNQHAMDNFSQRMAMSENMARENNADAIAQGLDAKYVMPLDSGELELGAYLHHSRNNSVITNPNNGMFFVDNFTNVQRDTASIYAQWTVNKQDYSSTLGARYTRVNMDAGEAGSNMVMMNPAVATLVSNFNAAERNENYNMLDIAATTRYHASDSLDIILGISQKNRAPIYFERYTWLPLGISGGMADGFNYIGNLDLDNETARKLDVGVDYTYKNWAISPRLFYQDIEDYITGSPSTNMAANMVSTMMAGTAPFQWTNTHAVIKGADMTVQGQFSENLSVRAVATIQHGNRDDIDDALFRIAPEQLTTTVRWNTQVFEAPLQMQFTSELAGAQNHISALQNEAPTAGYGLLHISGLITLFENAQSNLQVTATIHNLFNKQYAPHTAGINRVMIADVEVGERVPGAGREWHFGLSYQF
ncbi:TonB-dependent receptor [Alteromonas sp. V450]|uniref:TonB-dependent receptor n=1 Tax=Alteromonas sp. V450 TaxID=1912139 RepID=UPI0008FF2EA3|nr:TonB-dependent receptor [Alteromonas sp. V450]OJF70960.1 TonB-dependent receptor [Alteromonas sp. V450]